MRILKAGDPFELDDDLIVEADNLAVLPALPGGAFDLVYIDPPFNTGRPQRRRTLTAVRDEDGERAGFAGRRYRTEVVSDLAYDDAHADYLAFLRPASSRRGGCSPSTGRCTCTSTTARPTT